MLSVASAFNWPAFGMPVIMPYCCCTDGSEAAVEFADRSMEAVAYQAYWASTELAAERGAYSSFRGSLWDRGILPQDTLDLLAAERGGYVEVNRSSTLDWEPLRERVRKFGMRNSNCLAIAPTATISNIIGVSACIEPTFQNLYVKSNLSGEFTVVNVFEKGGERSPTFWGGRIDFLAFFHKPHFAVVEVAPLVPQRTEPGRAPARAVIDTTRPHEYVYMVRDLGHRRLPAAIITIASLILFLVLAWLLHRRDRYVAVNRAATALPAKA